MAKEKHGSWTLKLIWWVILLIIGFVIGRTPAGWETEKIYNTIRFRNTPSAENFLPNPFSLKIAYRQNDEGQLETYLVNLNKDEMLPIYEIENTTQVGDSEHRIKGLGDETRKKLNEILEGAKEGGTTALDKAKQLLEIFGE
jgi:hypothetical protein